MVLRPNRRAARRRLGLEIERLERRDLPTAPSLLAGPAGMVGLGSPTKMPSGVGADVAAVPTAQERAREAFVAKFAGSFVSGRGRFTNQASQTFIKGGGTSSAFLHGDVQMTVETPVDPSAQTTGLAALIVKNVSNSGNLLVLDLQGDTRSLDSAGRPTRFTWTVNAASGGTFSDATGQGTLEIRYWPGGKLPKRATAAGHAGVIFRGSIDNNGVTNVLQS